MAQQNSKGSCDETSLDSATETVFFSLHISYQQSSLFLLTTVFPNRYQVVPLLIMTISFPSFYETLVPHKLCLFIWGLVDVVLFSRWQYKNVTFFWRLPSISLWDLTAGTSRSTEAHTAVGCAGWSFLSSKLLQMPPLCSLQRARKTKACIYGVRQEGRMEVREGRK